MKKLIIFGLCLLLIVFFIIILIPSNNKDKNIFLKVKYYIPINKERYIEYYNKHNNFTKEKIVLYVNIGLDTLEYNNINIIQNVNFYSIVNKYNKLNNDYTPKYLVDINNKYTNKKIKVESIMINNLYQMLEDMNKNNLNPIIVSGYRTKEYQEMLYNNYKIKDKNVDLYSARPRHSEHELGLAVDVISKNSNMDSFVSTKEFHWLKYNSYRYGFILRYPKGKEYITKYKYEPWHHRYIGKKHAKKLHKLDITYEEYYYMFLN